MAIIDKRRSGPNVAEVMHLIGEVQGKTAILVDRVVAAAEAALRSAGESA